MSSLKIAHLCLTLSLDSDAALAGRGINSQQKTKHAFAASQFQDSWLQTAHQTRDVAESDVN